jgi:hypothetical protein
MLYICQSSIFVFFNCVWNSKSEPLARKIMYLSKHSGGLNIVNIEYNLHDLRLKHIQDTFTTI